MKKKFIIILSLILICLNGFSQVVFVSGFVKNIIGNAAISNHKVVVRLDSINFTTTLYTDINGYFSDSISNQLQYGIVRINTFDCNGVSVDSLKSFDTTHRSFNVNFLICDSSVNTCHADFTDSISGYNAFFYDNSTAYKILSWHWDFGDGTTDSLKNTFHTFSQLKIYNVCLTIQSLDSNGYSCSNTFCKNVVIVEKYNLGGQVFAGNYPIKLGYAYLYSTNNNIVNQASSMYFDTLGYYYFPQIIVSNYIVKIIPDSNNCTVTQYAPTYYGNTLFWEQAAIINDSSNDFSKDVNLIITSPNSGQGSFSGTYKFNGTLKPCTEILLLDINKFIITYAFTDANGNFNFNNIAYGTYILHAEDAGVITNYETITISANNPTAIVQLYNAILNVLNFNDNSAAVKVGDVFPNPVKNVLNIDVELAYSSNLIIELYNILGKKIFKNSYSMTDGKHNISIPVDELSNGIYFLHISSADNKFSEVKKFIK